MRRCAPLFSFFTDHCGITANGDLCGALRHNDIRLSANDIQLRCMICLRHDIRCANGSYKGEYHIIRPQRGRISFVFVYLAFARIQICISCCHRQHIISGYRLAKLQFVSLLQIPRKSAKRQKKCAYLFFYLHGAQTGRMIIRDMLSLR